MTTGPCLTCGLTPAPIVKLLLTPEEAAQSLGVGRSLVYQLIMHKRLFSVKVGGARRIPVHALEDYVQALCHQQEEVSDGQARQ